MTRVADTADEIDVFKIDKISIKQQHGEEQGETTASFLMAYRQSFHGSQVTSPHSWPVPQPGCYVPAVTCFDPTTDQLDLNAQAKYFRYLSSTGLNGLVVLGSNAETFLLCREERKALLQCARQSIPPNFPVIAGVMGHSTAQVLEYLQDAYDAGANYAMLLPCAYFGKQTTPTVIKEFFAQVATVTPLPIIIYNFPAVCNGLDLDSDIIAEIAQAHECMVGVKLTCGSVAKIARLAAVFSPQRFAVFGGQSDFLLGGLAVGSAGCVAAFANIFPRSVARLYELWRTEKHDEALRLQRILALAESPTKAGIACTKFAAAIMTGPRAGISDAERLLRPRRPYLEHSVEMKQRIYDIVRPLEYLEDELMQQPISARL